MSILDGKILEIEQLKNHDRERMFFLMDLFYDHMNYNNFIKDLEQKDYCIVLCDNEGCIQGFSTQQIIKVDVEGENVNGVFSGDTIVHKDFWGTRHPLFSVFGKFFEEYSRNYPEFYWFLICKGYKTYKILPTFFNNFYPNCEQETPSRIHKIIDAFGRQYSNDYNPNTGVVEYSSVKDTLKVGVADIEVALERNKHAAYFLKRNPGHILGHDLVCLTDLKKYNYQQSKERVLWG